MKPEELPPEERSVMCVYTIHTIKNPFSLFYSQHKYIENRIMRLTI